MEKNIERTEKRMEGREGRRRGRVEKSVKL